MFPARRRDSPSGAFRPEWYDRNATTKHGNFANWGIAPHSETVRINYTCPSGKKAMVELLYVKVHRATAATSAGYAASFVILTSVSARAILYAYIYTNGVGDKDIQAIGATLTLFAGDYIDFRTYDQSNGGTCDFLGSYKAAEFDA